MPSSSWILVAAADVPTSDGWLSGRERLALARYAVPQRRTDWRTGRWAARQAVVGSGLAAAQYEPAEIEILAAPDGAPELWADGKRQGASVSISHRDGTALAVVSTDAAAGCDLEAIESRPRFFATDFFTASEMQAVEDAPPPSRDALVTLIWSAKESVLKLTRQGLRLDTREVEVRPELIGDGRDRWQPFRASIRGHEMNGWWRQAGHLLMTAVTDPSGEPPAAVITPAGAGAVRL